MPTTFSATQSQSGTLDLDQDEADLVAHVQRDLGAFARVLFWNPVMQDHTPETGGVGSAPAAVVWHLRNAQPARADGPVRQNQVWEDLMAVSDSNRQRSSLARHAAEPRNGENFVVVARTAPSGEEISLAADGWFTTEDIPGVAVLHVENGALVAIGGGTPEGRFEIREGDMEARTFRPGRLFPNPSSEPLPMLLVTLTPTAPSAANLGAPGLVLAQSSSGEPPMG